VTKDEAHAYLHSYYGRELERLGRLALLNDILMLPSTKANPDLYAKVRASFAEELKKR